MYYGLDLARVFHADIHLIHAFYPAMELNTGYMIDPEIESRRKEELKALEQELREQAESHASHVVEVRSSFVLGFPIEEIVAHSTQGDQLIVMGGTGSSGIMGRLFGSVSSNVVKQAGCPVLIVPSESVFKPFENVMYASDQAVLDDQVEHLFIPWLEKFSTKMHVVHVESEKGVSKEYQRKVFDNLHPDYLIRQEIRSDAVVEALNKYVNDHQIDLMVLSTRRRSFWDRLVHVSVTRELALKPTVPILVLHESD